MDYLSTLYSTELGDLFYISAEVSINLMPFHDNVMIVCVCVDIAFVAAAMWENHSSSRTKSGSATTEQQT